MKFFVPAALLALGAAVAAAGGARAQITAPDSSLSLQFRTDGNGVLPNASLQVQAFGVGYDAANIFSKFVAGPSVATAQTGFNPFVLDTAIEAGSSFQIGVHAFAQNRAGTAPVNIFASIFAFDASAPTGTVPLGSPVVRDLPIAITSTDPSFGLSDVVYYTSPTVLPVGLNANTNYVISFAPSADPGAANPANYALVYRRVFSQTLETVAGDPTRPEASEFAFFRNVYQTNTNSAENGGVFTAQFTAPSAIAPSNDANPFAYQFFAAAVIPEPGTLSLLLLGGSVTAGALLLRRRRKSAG